MRRATITLPDDLEAEVEEYLAKQEAPPSLTSLIQAALRRFLDGPPWERTGSAGGRLEDLPALLASLPRLSELEAEELAADLDRAREELAREELTDLWSSPAPGGGSATGSA